MIEEGKCFEDSVVQCVSKGGLYINPHDVAPSTSYPSMLVYNDIEKYFKRATDNLFVCDSVKPVKLYCSIQSAGVPMQVLHSKDIVTAGREDYLDCCDSFLYDGDSTTIKSFESEYFYDLVMLTAFETLVRVTDRQNVGISEIRCEYVNSSFPPKVIGALDMGEYFAVIIALTLIPPAFAKLVINAKDHFMASPMTQFLVSAVSLRKTRLFGIYSCLAIDEAKRRGNKNEE